MRLHPTGLVSLCALVGIVLAGCSSGGSSGDSSPAPPTAAAPASQSPTRNEPSPPAISALDSTPATQAPGASSAAQPGLEPASAQLAVDGEQQAPAAASVEDLLVDTAALKRAWRDLFDDDMPPQSAIGGTSNRSSRGRPSASRLRNAALLAVYGRPDPQAVEERASRSSPRAPTSIAGEERRSDVVIPRTYLERLEKQRERRAALHAEAQQSLAEHQATFPVRLRLLKERLESDREIVRKGKFNVALESPQEIVNVDGKLEGAVFRDSRMKRDHIAWYADRIEKVDEMLSDFESGEFKAGLDDLLGADLPPRHMEGFNGPVNEWRELEYVVERNAPRDGVDFVEFGLRDLILGDIGYIFSGRHATGRMYELLCFEIIDHENMQALVVLRGFPQGAFGFKPKIVWIVGLDTRRFTEDEIMDVKEFFVLLNTVELPNRQGIEISVPVLRPFDLEKHLPDDVNPHFTD